MKSVVKFIYILLGLLFIGLIAGLIFILVKPNKHTEFAPEPTQISAAAELMH